MAKRNYRYFYLFLNTVMVMAIYIMGCNIAVIVIGEHACARGYSSFNSLQHLKPKCKALHEYNVTVATRTFDLLYMYGYYKHSRQPLVQL